MPTYVRRRKEKGPTRKTPAIWFQLIVFATIAAACLCGRVYYQDQTHKLNQQSGLMLKELEQEEKIIRNLGSQYASMCKSAYIKPRASDIGMIPPDGSNIRVTWFALEGDQLANVDQSQPNR